MDRWRIFCVGLQENMAVGVLRLAEACSSQTINLTRNSSTLMPLKLDVQPKFYRLSTVNQRKHMLDRSILVLYANLYPALALRIPNRTHTDEREMDVALIIRAWLCYIYVHIYCLKLLFLVVLVM